MARPESWTLVLRGRKVDPQKSPRRPAHPFGEIVRVGVRTEVRLAGLDRGDGPELELGELRGDDVVELDLGEGARWWTRVDELADLVAEEESVRGAGADRPAELAAGRLVLPSSLGLATAGRGPSRGVGRLVFEGLKLLDVDLAVSGARAIAGRLEDQLRPGPGLYFCGAEGQLETLTEEVTGPEQLPGGGPYLVFLHGTASNTFGSFSELGSEFGRLRKIYGERRILAFEHRTLTESPAENARDLLELLPEGAELHLVSHSRGGLVGELLCRGTFVDGREPFSARELTVVPGKKKEARSFTKEEAETLTTLGRLLSEKRPRIGRFVRVACPARGTLLASGRLDRALSLLLNALKLGAPALTANPIFDFLQALVVATVREREDPDVLPGIEAMMPSSPWVRLLNLERTPLEADLSVVAGDVEGSGVLRRLALLALDRLVFDEDHDLVVHTRAMYGGGTRAANRARVIFERGPDTTHFTYFRRRREEILSALEDEEPAGFQPLVAGRPVRAAVRGQVLEPTGERPVAVVLPGVLGSHLSVGGNRIWLDLDDLARGGFEKLRAGADVVADAVLGRYYDDLAEFLSRSHDVVHFPFDWRIPIEESGKKLRERLSELLAATDQSVRLVAHSMGGLVALASALDGDADRDGTTLWQRLRARRGFRFLMLGTPSRGSWVIPRIVFGRERIVRRLALLDLTNNRKELLEIFGEYQGLYDLLPSRGEADRDLFLRKTWQEWKKADSDAAWPVPKNPPLKDALAFRERLEALDLDLAPGQLVYVAGRAPETPEDVEIKDRGGKKRLEVVLSDRGDGRVLWETGPPEGARVWWTDAVHGKLPRHKKAFRAYQELLETGTTSRLPNQPPATRGARVRVALPPIDAVDLFPTEDDLFGDALGDEPEAVETREAPPLKVNVTHGDLRFARHPVLVGHYEDDGLYAAEGALDRQLGGRLRARHEIGLYPGAVETAEAFLEPSDPHRGAVVVGLGRVGELSPGRLEQAVTCGALRYAVAVAERRTETELDDEDAACEMGLSALLVGSGESGLGINAALRALVDGVTSANRRLDEANSGHVRITELEVVELFEERALRAAHALTRLAEDPGAGTARGGVVASETLRRVDGGVRQLRLADDEWWQRLRIAVPDAPEDVDPRDRPLDFTWLGDRARAEKQLVATRRRLLEDFVEDAVSDPRWNEGTATTLFELLVPNEFKDQARERRNLVLVVDEHSGAYPWELLHDGFSRRCRPLTVESGMIRQLATYRYRRLVDHPNDDTALVIGDPPSDWPPLPGAQLEAELVAERLKAEGWKVTQLVRPTSRQVLTALFSGAHRVLHIAAHGKFDTGNPLERGIVIGKGKILSPGDLKQMRRVPEFVFVNCCHLGRMDGLDVRVRGHRNDLAANVGLQLIEMGVRAVVAAGWVVDDSAADLFAREIYHALLDGQPFGTAVREARRKTYDEYRGVNTWGAYQCYGDPYFRLRKPRARPSRTRFRGVDPLEAEHRLENLTSQARVGADPARLDRELTELREILEKDHPDWLRQAGVQSRLGQAFAELSDLAALAVVTSPSALRRPDGAEAVAYENAIRHLRAALAADHGSASMDDARRVIDLELRFTVFGWKYPLPEEAGEDRTDQVARALESALARADQLIGISETVWRLVLRGTVLRFQAQLESSDTKKLVSLAKADESFFRAHRRAEATFGLAETYPALGWCLTQAVRELIGRSTAADFERAPHLGAVLRAGLDAAASEHSFWRRAAPGDAEIIQLVAECTAQTKELDAVLEQRSQAAFDAYVDASRRGGSPRQFHILIETLDWIVDLLAEEGGGEAEIGSARWRRRQARQAVAGVRQRFAKAVAGWLVGRQQG